ncbi:hypothetical protein C1T17_01785 [Sphingobium sp. SCG-1]|nr:hypothetical protein C1T17_01785 [Sphingobium sp. SCG-1]
MGIRAGAWAILVLLSIAMTWTLRTLHVPAALMLGPMISAVALAQVHGQLKLGRPVVMAAQALLGCRLGMAISPDLLHAALGYLPILFGFSLLIILITVSLAVCVSRAGWFPESTAVWGLSPGAASAMVMLSELYGSDPRIVAIMQYLRVLASALIAILVGTLLGSPEAHGHGIPMTGAAMIWFPPIDRLAFTETLLLALAGALAAWVSGRAVAVLFVPMLGGALLQVTGLGRLELPAFLLAATFAVIGWNIGLKFTRASLAASIKLMPRITVLIAAMIGLCGALSVLLSWLLGVDALSAYLALSPGGLDSVIIIATSTHVDLPLVLAAQIVRLIVVLIVAPPLARFIVQRGIARRTKE